MDGAVFCNRNYTINRPVSQANLGPAGLAEALLGDADELEVFAASSLGKGRRERYWVAHVGTG